MSVESWLRWCWRWLQCQASVTVDERRELVESGGSKSGGLCVGIGVGVAGPHAFLLAIRLSHCTMYLCMPLQGRARYSSHLHARELQVDGQQVSWALSVSRSSDLFELILRMASEHSLVRLSTSAEISYLAPTASKTASDLSRV